jgi:hypothetical protein
MVVVLAVLDIRVLGQILVVHRVVLVIVELLLRQHNQQRTPAQRNMEILVVLPQVPDHQHMVLVEVVVLAVSVELVLPASVDTVA